MKHVAKEERASSPNIYVSGGTSELERLLAAQTEGGVTVALVHFTDGAITHWHTHPGEQVLLVTAGECRFGNEDGEGGLARSGDVIHFPPGRKALAWRGRRRRYDPHEHHHRRRSQLDGSGNRGLMPAADGTRKTCGMRVVVTGGSGLAGSAVASRLLAEGCDVLSIDRVRPPQPIAEYRLVNCEDLGQVYGACQSADAIIHLAAIPRPIHHSPDQVFGTKHHGDLQHL